MIKCHVQNQLGRKRFTPTYGSTATTHHRAKLRQGLNQARNLEAGADANAMEEDYLIACSLWLCQPAFLEHPGPPVQGWHPPQ